VGDEIRVNGNTHRQGLQAGKIINGQPDDPSLEKYRVYKIRKGWEKLPPGPEKNAFEKDYNEWPIEDGAPYIDVNEDGVPTPGVDKPKFVGDETLWYVANDMDSARSRSTYGMAPMGLEFQTTIFGFSKYNLLGDVVFKKYKIINKGNNQLKDMYFGIWSDPDLGDANDDFAGCDTLLDMGYAYNSDNNDGIYGLNPPAVGYTILQGPIVPSFLNDSAQFDEGWRKGFRNLDLTSFVLFIGSETHPWRDPQQGVPAGSVEFYNYLQGLLWDGSSYPDPYTGLPVRFALPGDPVEGIGWYEGPGWPGGPSPADRRITMSSGPINLSSGDTQEVVFAIHMAGGYSNINSITILKKQSSLLKKLYASGFDYLSSPQSPVAYAVPGDNFVNLWWENNSENFALIDPLLSDTVKLSLGNINYIIPVTDSSYNFEGYRIWQFSNKNCTEAKVIGALDIDNDVSTIYNFPYNIISINGQTPVSPIISSPDEGIKRYFTIDKDAWTDSPLLNGKDYYFGITSYAYSKFSDPTVIESFPHIIKITPGILPIDKEQKYSSLDDIPFEHISGFGDGEIYARVIDPSMLTGNTYELSFNENSYILTDKTENDTLLVHETSFFKDTAAIDIIDGFILVVKNTGNENIGASPYKIRDVREIKGPGGIAVTPKDVFTTLSETKLNSTGKWTILSVDDMQRINYSVYSLVFGPVNFDDYEIRFTESGSEYYSSGYYLVNPLLKVDPKGKGRIPFEVWQIPADTLLSPVRLVIKIYDNNKDTLWNKTTNPNVGDIYESIYTFKPAVPYPDTLPPTSTYGFGGTTKSAYRIGDFVIKGELPEKGTVIKIRTWKPLTGLDKFLAVITAPSSDNELAKQNIYKISVFPNPYYAANAVMLDYPPFVRFTNLPQKAIIRIYSLSGVFIRKYEKDDESQYIDWDIKNKDGELAGSGIYIAHIDIPDVGTKIMKIAVVR